MLASALGACGFSASARMGGAGAAHASVGDGGSARDPLLYGAAGCHWVAAAALYLQPDFGGRSGTSAVSSIHIWTAGGASRAAATGQRTRDPSMLPDGDDATGLDRAQAGIPRRRIFAAAALEAKPYCWRGAAGAVACSRQRPSAFCAGRSEKLK